MVRSKKSVQLIMFLKSIKQVKVCGLSCTSINKGKLNFLKVWKDLYLF